MPDPPVPTRDQVLCDEPGAGLVVGADEGVVGLAEAIGEHVRDPLAAQPPDRRVPQARAGQDQPVDSPLGEHLELGPLPLGAVVGVAEDDVVAARQRHVVLHID